MKMENDSYYLIETVYIEFNMVPGVKQIFKKFKDNNSNVNSFYKKQNKSSYLYILYIYIVSYDDLFCFL